MMFPTMACGPIGMSTWQQRSTFSVLMLVAALLAFSFQVNAAGVGGNFHRELLKVRELEVVQSFGPCTTSNFVTIQVFNENDFSQRIAYSNTTTVILVINNNITLSRSFVMGANFSCTLVRPNPLNLDGVWLNYPGMDMPALRIQGATNIIFTGISFSISVNITDMPPCHKVLPEFSTNYTCPAIHLYRTWQITFTQGQVTGRTDIYRSGAVHVDYMTLWYNFTDRPGRQSFSTIRVSLCGDPVNLIRSNIRITNNDISGSFTPVLLYFGSVGVYVTNNYVHDFIFGGIQCGLGQSNVADCMLNTIQDNYVYLPAGTYYHADGGQIYYDLHWYNPGNMDSCNYMEGGMHCYYLDYCTTGLYIKGGACIRTQDGVKINNGKMNKVDSLLIISNPQQSGIMSCQNWCINNCQQWAAGFGFKWVTNFQAKYNNSLWRNTWPYLTDVCTRTSYNDVPCNTEPAIPLLKPWTGECFSFLDNSTGVQMTANSNITGQCSGIPTLNDVNLIVVNGSRRWPMYDINCDAMPNMRKFNNYTSANYAWGFFPFDDPAKNDYGVSDLSANIYQLYPEFMNCPRDNVGPQVRPTAMLKSYLNRLSSFNTEPAQWWRDTFSQVRYSPQSWDVFPRKARIPGEKIFEAPLTIAARNKSAAEKAAREKAAKEKAAREKAAAEKAAADKAAAEKAAAEKAAKDKAAKKKKKKKSTKKTVKKTVKNRRRRSEY